MSSADAEEAVPYLRGGHGQTAGFASVPARRLLARLSLMPFNTFSPT